MPHTSCPHCGKGFKCPEHLLGKKVRCPACKEVFLIPKEKEEIPELTPIAREEEEIPELTPLKESAPSPPEEPAEEEIEGKQPAAVKKRVPSKRKYATRKKSSRKTFIIPIALGGILIIACIIIVIALISGNGAPEKAPPESTKDVAEKPSEEIIKDPERERTEELKRSFYSKTAEAETADALYDLAMWCRENDLNEFIEKTLQKALTKDPNHEKTRQALGYVRNDRKTDLYFDRDWLNKAEAKAVAEKLAEIAKEKAAREKIRANDPYFSEVDRKIEKVKSHPYFQDIVFTISEDYRPYLIFVEEGRDFHCRQLGKVLSAFYKNFHDRYHNRFKLPEIDSPLVIISLKTKDRYYEYGKMMTGKKPTSLAHYELNTKQIIVHGTGPESYPYGPIIYGGVVTHEATHQLVDYFTIAETGNPFPMCQQHWFQEGFAEFTGSLRELKKSRKTGQREFKFNQFHDSRMLEFENAVRNGEYFSFEEMVSIANKRELEDMAREKNPKKHLGLRSLFYAQAWSFVYFCHHYEKGKYKEKFLQYMGEELKGNTGLDVFHEVFGKKNLKKIESEWWEYLKQYMKVPEGE